MAVVDVADLRTQLTNGALNAVTQAVPLLLDSLVGNVWDWQSGGDRDEFPEHVALNGGFGATIAAYAPFSPGDHPGCRCTLVDVKSTAQVQGITGSGSGAVAVVDFGVGFDAEPLSISVSVGGVTVTSSTSGGTNGWSDLVLQIEERWPQVLQQVIDGGALGG